MSSSASPPLGAEARPPRTVHGRGLRRFVRDNGLSLVLLGLFLASLAGQFLTGLAARNEDRAMHGLGALSAAAYLGGGEFLAVVFENWESEFLQMAAYVLLTVFLRQRGSPESKPVAAPQDRTGR